MSFKNMLEVEKQNSRFKSRVIAALFILLFLMAVGWSRSPDNIKLHYPPDLRSGAVMNVNEIHASEVYIFTQYILQQLNNWDKNGEKDYLVNINKLRPYFTPAYQTFLDQDYESRKSQGELRKRVRKFAPAPGASYKDYLVEPIGDAWLVWIDVLIDEYVNGGLVKTLSLRIPMQVVRYDVDPELNPWGLGLDGPGNNKPKLLKVE